MNLWTKEELLQALSTELLDHNLQDSLANDEVVIDSRKTPKSGLFIALKGEINDGHDFLEQAFTNGCKVALIQDSQSLVKIPHQQFLLVKDTFKSLYKLAEFSRQRSLAKIIAITGSVGKTGTKELLKNAFSAYGKTFATEGNLNNHFGLPLSLCNFSRDCAYGIFELGMNHLGEIEPLSRLAKPHLAIITNVGPAHIEHFKNEEEIALAKSEIFCGIVDGGSVLLNKDNQHFEFLVKRAQVSGVKDQNIVSFGEKKGSDYQILANHIINSFTSEVQLQLKNAIGISYKISTSHLATIFNSTIVVACLDMLGRDLSDGLKTFCNLQTPVGRGKISEINLDGKNITIIDDSYNASVLSMRAGLNYAENLKKVLKNKQRVVAALGDMLELGEKSLELHEKVLGFLEEFFVDFAVLVGKEMINAAKTTVKIPNKTFLDSNLASLEIKDLLRDGDILYVKGSRGMKMEKIIEQLTDKTSAH